MRQVITGKWSGKRSNGVACTITQVAQYDNPGTPDGKPRDTFLLIDQEPTEWLSKGTYRVLPHNEVITSDDPDAP